MTHKAGPTLFSSTLFHGTIDLLVNKIYLNHRMPLLIFEIALNIILAKFAEVPCHLKLVK
jgi:hypothetical protein